MKFFSEENRQTGIDVTIHLGLHKTASTFLQRHFFSVHADDLGYVDLRTSAPEFLACLLHCGDLDWDTAAASSMLEDALRKMDRQVGQRMLISDEQFCGSPWDNVACRKRSFDRLKDLFPEAKYVVVFRNQPDLVQSLYLQYVKTGGSASWKEFLDHKIHPLQFGLKSYLNYGPYLKYILSHVDRDKLGCFFYEEMRADAVEFCRELALFLQIETKEDLNQLVQQKANKSISPFWARIIVHTNKFCRSERQPFLLLPRTVRLAIVLSATRLSFSRNKNAIAESAVTEFCKEVMSSNSILQDFADKDISRMGY